MSVNHATFIRSDVTPVALFIAAPDLQRYFQQQAQMALQAENIRKAEAAVKPKDVARQNQPERVISVQQPMQMQQQVGGILKMTDAEREALQISQRETQQRLLTEALAAQSQPRLAAA